MPIEGVHFILGNGLASSRVWADTFPLPVVTPCLAASESTGTLPDVSSTCVVTRAMAKLNLDQSTQSSSVDVLSLSDLPLSFSHSEVVQEQREDPSLKGLYKRFTCF